MAFATIYIAPCFAERKELKKKPHNPQSNQYARHFVLCIIELKNISVSLLGLRNRIEYLDDYYGLRVCSVRVYFSLKKTHTHTHTKTCI